MSDFSAAANLHQSEIDERVAALFELEEPPLVYHLIRDHYGGRQTCFGRKSKNTFEEEVGSAVDDQRHSTVYRVAKAVSVCELREKVVERCLKDMLVPSDEWIRPPFSPVCLLSHSDTALRYTSWSFGSETPSAAVLVDEHKNAHYAACLFRYEREYAV